jgi:hypothetical protein
LKRSYLVLAIFAIMAALVMPSLNVRANPDADGLWATTAEFDAGTKNDAGSNYGIETVTDNGGISANTFELGSLKGDEFTHSDLDGVTDKWVTKSIGSGANKCSYVISGGTYTISEPNDAGVEECAAVAQATVSGSFDVRVKLNFASGNTKVYELCVISTKECESGTAAAYSGSANGFFYWNLVGTLQPYKVVNGVVTAVGTGTAVATNPLWTRISRSGNDFTFYYSSDGSSWTTDETDTLAGVPTSLYPGFGQVHNGGAYGATSLVADSFRVTAGAVDSPGYKTSGNWLSDHYLVGGTLSRIGFIVLNFTGVSATYAIDKVEVYRNDVLREALGNDIVSGTSKNLTVTGVVETAANLSMRIYLKGDGAGTATITRIQVFMVSLANLVSTVSAYQIGAHSVMLAANLTYDAEPDGWLEIMFDFGTTPLAHERVNVGWVDGAGNFTVLLYELDPATVYYFHARVEGNYSGSADGDLMQFETLGTAGLSPLLILLMASFVIALFIGLRSSPLFLILAGLLLLIATVVVDADLLSSQADLVRYGTFVVLVIMSLLLFVQGALNLPDEFKGGGWKLGGR